MKSMEDVLRSAGDCLIGINMELTEKIKKGESEDALTIVARTLNEKIVEAIETFDAIRELIGEASEEE